jgi:hypothetical protein
MKKLFLLAWAFLLTLTGFSRKEKDTGPGLTKLSTASITKVVPNKTHLEEVVLIVTFKCPSGDDCTKKGIKMDFDTQKIPVKLDKNKNFVHIFKPGKFPVSFSAQGYYNANADSVAFKKGTRVFMTVIFEIEQKNLITRKPVIYLYPQEKTDVNVQLDYHGDLEFTYPQYSDGGWDIKAWPDGTIETEGKKFNYLFWDGKMDARNLNPDFTRGSIVESYNVTVFLENTLAQIGLNSKEIADFITYWVPQMQQNKKNYIHFMLDEDYNQIATIKVSPEPDKMLRVFMIWMKTENEIPDLLPQTFNGFKREGFTLIEWGGTEYNLQAK